MNRKPALLRLAATLAATTVLIAGCATATISDTHFSLLKGSVFEVVPPAPFSFDAPGAGKTIPPAPGSGIPPMISHAIDEYLPLAANKNECLDCHDKPERIGKPVASGKARPASTSHYVSRSGTLALAGTQYNCMACHAPQAEAQPLVRNTSQ